MEQEIIHHFFHQHPLSRINQSDYNNWCHGCWRFFLPGEAAYGCSRKCGFGDVLHRECMEMPREIRHPVHPSHPLALQDSKIIRGRGGKCAVCEWVVSGLVYKCSGGCELWIHLGCAVGFDDEGEKHPPINHPSHPQHQLKKTSSCSFLCNACGTTDKGNSYICTICDYWIHESCALLPASACFPRHPHHSLSLAFHPPYEYIIYKFECAVCSGPLRLRNWVYHCQLCRYIVHINCASSPPPSNLFNNEKNAIDDEKDITKGPIDDIYEEIIRPFVKRERGENFIIPDDSDNISGKYKFSNHHHLLSFTVFSAALSSSHIDPNEEDDDKENDDDDDVDSIPRSELTCDGCTMAIHDECDNGYMSCDKCQYFLHLACFNLPPNLPSLSLHPIKHHNLTLRNSGKLSGWTSCDICYGHTNGLFYSCTKCYFKLDIKCASLPNTIKHAAHPQHSCLKLDTDNRGKSFCRNCYGFLPKEKGFYSCNSCKFSVCGGCVLLPARNKHRLENHWLSLTYDANVNHPSEFYCSNCENQMNPKRWMYHCRDCDQSFHPKCFPATSGWYRNINYGRQQYVISTIHNHPLRFQIITKKKRCNLCHGDKYDKPGFQCASCNFVMCLYFCGLNHIGDFKAI